MALTHQALWVLFLVISGSQAQEINLRDCLHGQSSVSIPLNIDLGRYIEGRVKLTNVNLNQEGVTLLSDVAGKNRVLFRNKAGEQNFLLWYPNQNQASLTLQAPKNTSLCYEFVLKYSTAQNDNKTRFDALPQSPRLQSLQNNLHQSKQKEGLLRVFWQTVQKEGTPLIEPIDDKHSLLTFLWRGAKYNVRLVGGPSNDHEWLTRLPQTDIWFKSFKVSNDVRLSYQFAPDIPLLMANASDKDNAYRQRRALLSTIQVDPFNNSYFGDASLVDLADVQNIIVTDKKNTLAGTLQQYAFHSQILENQRRIWIYQTDKFSGTDTAINWVYLFDGQEYLDYINLPDLLDKLRQDRKIQPTIVVLIDNAGGDARSRELPANPDFADMLVQELIPFVESRTGQMHKGDRTVLAGSSYGGLAAAYIASRYPQHFAKVLAMSGSFWWHPNNQSGNAMALLFKTKPLLPVQWFIGAGYYETPRDKNDLSILNTSYELAEVLRDKGYSITFKVYPGGHDYAIWQHTITDGLSVLLP